MLVSQPVMPTDAVAPILLWTGVLVAVVMTGLTVLLIVRRRMLAEEEGSSDVPLTLQDLREMRRAGRLSDEEFERMKGLIIGQASRVGGEENDAARIRRAREAAASSEGLSGVETGELRARPGFDLTGEPLPSPEEGHEDE